VFVPVAMGTEWAVALSWRSRAGPTNQLKEKLADVTVKVRDRFLSGSQELVILQEQKQLKCLRYYLYCLEEHQWTLVYRLEEFKVACVEDSLTVGFPLKERGERRMVSLTPVSNAWMLAMHIFALPFSLIYSHNSEAFRRFTNYIIRPASCVAFKWMKLHCSAVVNCEFGFYFSRTSPADLTYVCMWMGSIFCVFNKSQSGVFPLSPYLANINIYLTFIPRQVLMLCFRFEYNMLLGEVSWCNVAHCSHQRALNHVTRCSSTRDWAV